MLKPHLSAAVKTIVIVALAAALSAAGIGAAMAAERQYAQANEEPSAVGTVNSVDVARRELVIAHGPVAALGWPGMTMAFAVAPEIDLRAIKPGAKVAFTLIRGAGGKYVIDQIRPAE